MIVCLCRGISDRDIKRAMADGAKDLCEVMAASGAGTGCGSCLPQVERLLRTEKRALRVLPRWLTSTTTASDLGDPKLAEAG